VPQLGPQVEVAEPDLAAVAELRPVPPAGRDHGRRLIEVVDHEPDVVQGDRRTGPYPVPVEVHRAVDRADDLQVDRARVDQGDVDHPLVGRLPVHYHERRPGTARADRAADGRRKPAAER